MRRLRGVEAAEVVVQLRDLPTASVPGSGGVESLLQGAREASSPDLTQPDARGADFAQRIIDGVDAGAGHDAEDKLAFCNHCR